MGRVKGLYRIFKFSRPSIHRTGKRRQVIKITEPLIDLGAHSSSIESMVANELNRRNVIWESQVPFAGGRQVKGGQVVDFYLPAYNLVIRVQGDYYHTLGVTNARDDAQAIWLKGHGLLVADVWEHDILADVRAAIDVVIGKA